MKSMLSNIEKILLRFERAIMLSVGLLLPAMITVGVIFRYILKTDLFAIEEFEVFLAIWFYFMGSAYASYKKQQITADILQAMVKSFATRKLVAIIASLIMVLVSIAFCYYSFDMMAYSWDKQPRTAVWKLPLVWEYLAVLLGFIIMTVYSIRDFVHACKRTPNDEIQEVQ